MNDKSELEVQSILNDIDLLLNRTSRTDTLDGLLELTISPDAMAVIGDFYPPVGHGRPLSTELVQTILESKGVIWGVHWPFIKAALSDCVLTNMPVKGVLVAAGLPPIPERLEHVALRAELLEKRPAFDPQMLTVDWKTYSPLTVVHQGQVLADVVSAQEGITGFDVKGHELPYRSEKVPELEPGDYIEKSQDQYLAAIDGVFRYSENRFWIDQLLVLEEGVNYATGNIDFPGDILIKREIAAGFRVSCAGSLYAQKVLDVTEITCGRDLITSVGLIGQEKGTVFVSGKLGAKFLERVDVRCLSAVEITTGILHCHVKSQDVVRTGPRGLIMGSILYAQNGIEVFQIGSERGSPSELHCGVDFVMLEEIAKLREQLLQLLEKQRFLEAELVAKAALRNTIVDALRILDSEIQSTRGSVTEVLSRLDRNEKAEVYVRGTAFPGTLIEIGHASVRLEKNVSHSKFLLDRNRGLIVSQPL